MEQISISHETAAKEFAIFEEYYEIEDFSDEDKQRLFNQAKEVIIKAIQKSRVQISLKDNALEVVQVLKNGTRIKYREIDGRAKMEMGKAKDGAAQVYALLGALSGDGPGIANLKGKDLSTAESLAIAFLAV